MRLAGLTTGQLRALLRRLCLQADPEEAEKRFERAVEARHLWIEATTDGTAHVHLYHIALTDARRIGRRINQHQINLSRQDRSGRTHDQLRADIATDLLTGDTTTGSANINVHVDLTTLNGTDDQAASLDGVEAIHADIARQLADRSHANTWEYTVTDDEGRIVQVGTTRRRPSKTLSRHVTARHPTCSFPGCRMPAVDCDLDHLTAWREGGPTTLTNTGPKCRHDHQLKDHGWTHTRQNDQDHWTSPHGHTYITQGQSP